jgi:hypothetical protein
MDRVFTDLELAEVVKARLQEYLPYRRFAVEATPSSDGAPDTAQ